MAFAPKAFHMIDSAPTGAKDRELNFEFLVGPKIVGPDQVGTHVFFSNLAFFHKIE